MRGSAGVQHPGILILDIELVEGGDEASLVPHRSRLGDLERREGRGGLHRHEGRVSLRERDEETWAPTAGTLLGRRGALWNPRVVADPGTHGPVLAALLRGASSTAARLAAARAALALALAFPAAAALVAAAVAADVGVVGAARVGPGGGGAAPARTSAARAGRSEKGGVDDGLLVVGQAEFFENQHVVGSGERGKNGGVGDVGGGVGEARVEATQ